MFLQVFYLHACLVATALHVYIYVYIIPYSQALRLNRICLDTANFDKRCNDLEKWLMEGGYNEKMIRKQVLRAVNIREMISWRGKSHKCLSKN